MSSGPTGGYAQIVFNGLGTDGMGILEDPSGNWFGFTAYPEAFIGYTASVPGVWTDLALVTSGGTTTFYVNGVVAGTASGTALSPTSVFNIGINPSGGGTQPFQGSIDEVRVFTFLPGQFSTNSLLLNSAPLLSVGILPAGHNVVIPWNGITLQQAGTVTGPWNKITNATSPWVAPVTGVSQFYRAAGQ
jgi:hypothetical protein